MTQSNFWDTLNINYNGKGSGILAIESTNKWPLINKKVMTIYFHVAKWTTDVRNTINIVHTFERYCSKEAD